MTVRAEPILVVVLNRWPCGSVFLIEGHSLHRTTFALDHCLVGIDSDLGPSGDDPAQFQAREKRGITFGSLKDSPEIRSY